MAKCNTRNCTLNEEGNCWEGMIIDGICTTCNIDDSKCDKCGANLEEGILLCNLEHFGYPCNENGLVCPNGCYRW